MQAPLELSPDTKAVLIAGPTASGKSAIALDVAERHGAAVIINADSMQVYKDLWILTARPSVADTARADHRLYGFLPGSKAYSVGMWLTDVSALLESLSDMGQLAIIVGGTGLYFKALCEGLASVPPIPMETREYWRQRLSEVGEEPLSKELLRRDPGAVNREALQDPQRLVRALEVLDATGRPLRDWLTEGQVSPLDRIDRVNRMVLMPERERLYQRINDRAYQMIEKGAIDEVETLLQKDLSVTMPVMKAIGVREIQALLKAEMDKSQVVGRIATATRRYAKRQMTWIRNQMGDWPVVDPFDFAA